LKKGNDYVQWATPVTDPSV